MKNLFLLLCFLLLAINFSFVSTEAQEKKIVPAVKNSKILLTLRKDHPRLLATSADFANLKKEVNTDKTLGNWLKKLTGKGEKIIASPPAKYTFSERDNMLETSRQVLKRIYTLGILYQITGDKKYADRAWLELENAANFPNWNPPHFLDTAEMTHAFAIGYDWFYTAWTEQQRNFLEKTITEKGLNEAQLAYQGKATYKRTWWIDSKNNWNQVCNGGIGMGALAIADKNPELSEAILQHVITVLPNAMQKFGPDGAWNEGPGYWDLATRYNVIFLASLESALGTDFGLSKIDGFSKTALFPLYLNGPTNKAFNFADASDEEVNGPQLFWLANKFNIPLVTQFQKDAIESPQALDLVWYKNIPQNSTPNQLPLGAYFRSAEIATMRSSWTDPNAWYVGFKTGDNQANHSHLDLGSFVLDAFGERWAIDLGPDNYKLPNYFDDDSNGMRWTYYRTRAEGHNTLVFNPGHNPDQNPLAQVKISKFQNQGNTSFAIADLSPAYNSQPGSIQRGIALIKGQSVVVQDEIKNEKPADVYWFMHTPAKISLQANGKHATLNLNHHELEVDLISPANARFVILPAAPLPESPQPKGTKSNENIWKLAIKLGQVKEGNIIVEFSPPEKKSPVNALFYKPLNTWAIN